MSNSQITEQQDVTPPPTFREPPLTPPLTNKKPAAEARPLVIALFQKLQAGRYTEGKNWIEFWLAKGEFDQIQSTLQRDDALLKYAQASIRYDYDETTLLLVVRMPTGVHEFFIAEVEKDIGTQIEVNRDGPSRRAQFAKNIRPARSTEIRFTGSKSRFHPDISFGHRDARFPGVIIEVAFSQDYKRLRRLAENYLLDSIGNIRVVVGINIAYGKGSRRATLSIWRSKVSASSTVYDVDVEEEMKDEIFRDDEGNPVEHPGLRLHLSDFTSKKIVQEQMGDDGDDDDPAIYISGTQLCQYVATAEDNVQRATREDSLPAGIKINKRRRSTTPPEDIRSEDEAYYVKQEKKVAKRGDDDSDYEYT